MCNTHPDKPFIYSKQGGLLCLGAAFLLSLSAGCRNEIGDDVRDLAEDRATLFASLNDDLSYANAGYGASVVLTGPEDGTQGAIAFQSLDGGISELVVVDWDSSSVGEVVLSEQVVETGVGDLFEIKKRADSDLKVIVGAKVLEGGTANLAVWEETSAGSWTMTVLDQNDDNGRFVDFEIDAEGALHIGYISDGGKQLRYIHWQDGVFLTQPTSIVTVDGGVSGNQVGSAGEIGSAVSLLLDAEGRPIISYYDGSAGQLRIAYQESDGLTWTTQVVGRKVSQRVLTVQSNGLVNLNEGLIDRKAQITLYKDLEPQSDSSYSIESESSIRISNVDSSAGEYLLDYVTPISLDYGVWSSIQRLQGGSIVATIYDFRGGRLMYAVNNDIRSTDTWTVETIDSAGIVGSAHELVLMPVFENGVQIGEMPVVAYQDIGNSDLLLAYRQDGVWQTLTLVPTGLTGFGPSMVPTTENKVIIAYREHQLDESFSANLQLNLAQPIKP